MTVRRPAKVRRPAGDLRTDMARLLTGYRPIDRLAVVCEISMMMASADPSWADVLREAIRRGEIAGDHFDAIKDGAELERFVLRHVKD